MRNATKSIAASTGSSQPWRPWETPSRPKAIDVVLPVACETKCPKSRNAVAFTMPAQAARDQPKIKTHQDGLLKAARALSAFLNISVVLLALHRKSSNPFLAAVVAQLADRP